MRKSTFKALAKIETGLVQRLRALRARVNHLEHLVDGLRSELERERDERTSQMDFVTQILGPLVADLEHRALDGDSETRAAYDEIVESTEAEEDRQAASAPDAPVPAYVGPKTLVQQFYEGLS